MKNALEEIATMGNVQKEAEKRLHVLQKKYNELYNDLIFTVNEATASLAIFVSIFCISTVNVVKLLINTVLTLFNVFDKLLTFALRLLNLTNLIVSIILIILFTFLICLYVIIPDWKFCILRSVNYGNTGKYSQHCHHRPCRPR